MSQFILQKNNWVKITVICSFLFFQNLIYAVESEQKTKIKYAGVVLVQKASGNNAVMILGAANGMANTFTAPITVSYSTGDGSIGVFTLPVYGFPVKQVNTQSEIRKTAANALEEKTYNQVKVDPVQLISLPRVILEEKNTQLFIYKDNNVNPQKLSRTAKQQYTKRYLPKDKREFSEFEVVPVSEILKSIRCVKVKNYPEKNHYCYKVIVSSSRKRKELFLDKYYIDGFAKAGEKFEKALEYAFEDNPA